MHPTGFFSLPNRFCRSSPALAGNGGWVQPCLSGGCTQEWGLHLALNNHRCTIPSPLPWQHTEACTLRSAAEIPSLCTLLINLSSCTEWEPSAFPFADTLQIHFLKSLSGHSHCSAVSLTSFPYNHLSKKSRVCHSHSQPCGPPPPPDPGADSISLTLWHSTLWRLLLPNYGSTMGVLFLVCVCVYALDLPSGVGI